MTQVLSDVEIIEQLDFEPDIACEAKKAMPCPNAAEWYVICRWCRNAPAMCDEHVQRLRKISAQYGPMLCFKCGGRAPSFDDLVLIVPVKGQS